MAEQVAHRTAPVVSPGLGVAASAGVLLVAYSWLVALWPSRHGSTPDVVVQVRLWVNKPTGMSEDFGFLGTALLLLVAGYALTGPVLSGPVLSGPVGSGPVLFGRLARVLRAGGPPLLVAVVAGAVLRVVGLPPLTDAAVTAPVGALVLFTALAFALRPLTRRSPGLAVFVLVEIAFLVTLAAGWLAGDDGSGPARLVGKAAALVPVLALGQLSWLHRAGRLPAAWGVGLGLLFLALLVPVDTLFPELKGYWHPLGATTALLLFMIAVPRGETVARSRLLWWSTERAWPLFLAVPVVGYPVLTLLDALPFPLALPVALAATVLAGEALHRTTRWSA
ncbi:hypothetical protein GCM10010492_23030 [Saccharothrix mutabilis subsp. mutabilis]|uniref:Uncharacterized protein n=1 Tax=Saccharothrix mutabilis subsp. mutabilis TaxID=66855 RepID=A0ABP3D5X9_9PSEU